MSVEQVRLIGGWLLEAALLAALLTWTARRVGGCRLLRLTLGSFGLRLAVGEGLYLISLLRLPVFPGQQVPGGFWAFATDAIRYDAQARAVAALLTGRPPGVPVTEVLLWPVGVAYAVFGDTLAHGILLNAAVAASCVPLAYLTAAWAGLAPRAALGAAALVGFWPSSLAWSGTLLKDPLRWLAVFLMLAGSAGLLSVRSPPSPGQVLGRGLLVLAGAHLSAMNQFPQAVAVASAVLFASFVWLGRQRGTALRQAVAATAALTLALAAGTSSYLLWRPIRPLWRPIRPAPVRIRIICPPAAPLLRVRESFRQAGGATQVDPDVQFTSCADLIAYVPRAYSLIFVEPLPRWWARGASVGAFRYFSAADAVLLWVLLPGLVRGLAAAWRRRETGGGIVVVAPVLLVGLVLGFVVTNFGTLFRIRLQVLLPAVLLAADGWTALLSGRRPGDAGRPTAVH